MMWDDFGIQFRSVLQEGIMMDGVQSVICWIVDMKFNKSVWWLRLDAGSMMEKRIRSTTVMAG